MKTLLVLSLFFTTYCLAQGKYYKWTDQNGTIHYSENKPETTQSSELNIKASKPTSVLPTKNAQKESEQKKETTSKLKEFAKQDQNKRDAAKQRKRRCRDAKKSMEKLKNSFTPYIIDSKSGGRIYPTSRKASKIKARQQERIRKKQIQVNLACKKWK